jgi:ubiquitin C-terminal hydrolase
MREMWLKHTDPEHRVVHLAKFKRTVGHFSSQFKGCRQHDAQEFISYLLDGIHEDLNRVKKRPQIQDKDCDGTNDEKDAQAAWANYLRRNQSLIVDLFQGQFRNTCVCMKCGHHNTRFETSMYLSLPIAESCT